MKVSYLVVIESPERGQPTPAEVERARGILEAVLLDKLDPGHSVEVLTVPSRAEIFHRHADTRALQCN